MVNVDLVNVGAQENVMSDQLKALGPLKILVDHRYLEVMLILAPINCKAPLIGLVSDAVADFGPKHHLVAVHVVSHYVLELGPQCYLVDQVEGYLVIRGHLDSNIAFDVVDETT